MKIKFFNKFNKLNYKKRIFILVAVFGVIIFLFIKLIFLTSKSDMEKLLIRIQEQKIDLEKKYSLSQKSRNEAEKNKKVDEELLLLGKVFVSTNRSLEFITALEDLSSKGKVMQKINLSKPDAVNPLYEKVGLQLNLSGSFENLMKYLVKIDTLGYYVNINSLEIKDDQNNTGNIMYLTADTYWQK